MKNIVHLRVGACQQRESNRHFITHDRTLRAGSWLVCTCNVMPLLRYGLGFRHGAHTRHSSVFTTYMYSAQIS